MAHCAVYGCKNNSRKTKDISYYRFPKRDDIKSQWINSCSRRDDKINTSSARICSIHFDQDDFHMSLRHKLMNYLPSNVRRLKENAIPTKHLYKQTRTESKSNLERNLRAKKREQKQVVSDLLQEISGNSEEVPQQTDNLSTVCVSSDRNDSVVLDLKKQIAQLKESNLQLILQNTELSQENNLLTNKLEKTTKNLEEAMKTH
ncbi:THAP domain-containing protein 1-like [Photinus pyralis]|uniref:THAP domain-containing protein 1-like n=1 Tax=Photinus pyralis TaxID=7054 RepID=UPI0012673EE7|nr:THAP domain-containing protein 1-like [Photinus pyralis]